MKGHNKRLWGQTINKTVTNQNHTEPKRTKTVIWNWALLIDSWVESRAIPGSSQMVILIVVTLASYYKALILHEFLFMKTIQEVEMSHYPCSFVLAVLCTGWSVCMHYKHNDLRPWKQKSGQPSGVARAFPGGRVAQPESQNEEENEESLRKNKRKLSKFGGKWGKWNSCPPGTVRLATALGQP